MPLKDDLFDILDERFDMGELNLLCFRLHIDYEDLGGEGKQEKILELLNYLERRGRLLDILDSIRVYRKDIDITGLHARHMPQAQGTLSRSTPIAFHNRDAELQFLTNPYSPQYILIDAPAGYGKTRLLQELKDRYDTTEGWTCALVDFSHAPLAQSEKLLINALGGQVPDYVKPHPPKDSVQEYIKNLASTFNKAATTDEAAKGVVLIFDSVDALNETTTQWLLNDFIIFISRALDRIGFRRSGHKFQVIVAGRYMATRWENLAHGKLAMSFRRLVPFHMDAIMDAVRDVSQKALVRLLNKDVYTIACHIMRLTGGHPGCMATILGELHQDRFIDFDGYFNPNGQEQIHNNIVDPVIGDVRQCIPEDLRLAFEVLSVFRRFEYQTIKQLVEDKKIAWMPAVPQGQDPTWVLFRKITSTHLVNLENGYYSDGTVRRLLAIKKQQAPEGYVGLCRYAENFYQQQLLKNNSKAAYVQTIEITFQQLQRQQSIPQQTHAAVLLQIYKTLNIYLGGAGDTPACYERAATLKENLTTDWEWRYLVNDVLETKTDEKILGSLAVYIRTIEVVSQLLPQHEFTFVRLRADVLKQVSEILGLYLDGAEDDLTCSERANTLKEELMKDGEWRYLINDVLGKGTDKKISTTLESIKCSDLPLQLSQ